MILLFLLATGAATLFIAAASPGNLRIAHDKKNAAVLAEAKASLFGYAVSHVNAGERPGDFPLPDRLISPHESPTGYPNYDGNTDSCTGSGIGMVCIGRLPWKTMGMMINLPTENDSTGVMPWYAVSANLIDPAGLDVLNSDTLKRCDPVHPATYPCDTTVTALPHSWLTVRDSQGNVTSNRVAAVLIVPGPPLAKQTHFPPPALGGPDQYLDSVTVPASCVPPCLPGTYSNYNQDNDFIAGNQSPIFNDRLLYLTIDDLMQLVLKRVVREIRTWLNRFYSVNGAYPPNAAPNTPPYACNPALTSGALTLQDGTCVTAPTLPHPSLGKGQAIPIPVWFKDNWIQAVTYQRIAPDQAKLTVNGQDYVIAPN